MVHLLYYLKKKLIGLYDREVLDTYFYSFIEKYYMMFKTNKKGIRHRQHKRKVIISLTTIPERIDSVWVTIESLLRQSYKPDEIILWLAEDEFPNRKVPEKLQEQVKRGLCIRYCKNIKSYKKIIYTVQNNPRAYIITVDDDIVYSEKLVESLLKEYRKYPQCIICSRSHLIKTTGGKILPYNRWKKFENRREVSQEPSYSNFFTSGAGTLFPAEQLNEVVLKETIFMNLAPTADDVWLNFVAWISGLMVVNINSFIGDIIVNREISDNGLQKENVFEQKNDIQIKKVLEYLQIKVEEFLP